MFDHPILTGLVVGILISIPTILKIVRRRKSARKTRTLVEKNVLGILQVRKSVFDDPVTWEALKKDVFEKGKCPDEVFIKVMDDLVSRRLVQRMRIGDPEIKNEQIVVADYYEITEAGSDYLLRLFNINPESLSK